MKPLSYEEAVQKAAAYCSLAEKCPYDLREKLRQWKVASEATEKIIAYLIKEKFIDERRYCEAFTKDKFRFLQWGRQKIAYALQAKHLPADAIRQALQTIDEETYTDCLQKLLQQKLKTIHYTDEYDKKAKLTRFAQSRGFELKEIYEVMKLLK